MTPGTDLVNTSETYLEILNRSTITFSPSVSLVDRLLPGFFTQHPIFAAQITNARKKLEQHFQKGARPTRPLNSLVLGPPGSGKSRLVKALADGAADAEHQKPWRKSYNLSQFGSFTDIRNMFDEIARQNAEYSFEPGIVFIDEFDVRIGGVSAIQAFISPIYDRDDFRNIAFIFSGSYLKNRRMLGTQLDNAMEFDLRRCLAVYRVYTDDPNGRARLAELDEIFWRLEQKETKDPDQSVINYLASLEKLVDFRSRINGFVIEIPDLDAPLDVTQDPFKLSLPRAANSRLIPNVGISGQLLEFARTKGSSRRFAGGFVRLDEPVFLFKDMLLRERLWRVISIIGGRLPKGKVKISIDRALLNYFATVPVRHGMRSIEYLLSNCTFDKDLIACDEPDLEMLRLHIRNIAQFQNPQHVWSKIREINADHTGWNDKSAHTLLKYK